MNIQWYPGHMTKTMRIMRQDIALVDVVIELLDARIPYSSKNPDIDDLSAGKPKLVLLNKADLANQMANEQWAAHFAHCGSSVLLTNAATGMGIAHIAEEVSRLTQTRRERLKARGRSFVSTRAMITGIPNVGKSTLINSLLGRAALKTADRPGVTRGKQWVKVRGKFELLDTPGILWPRFDDPTVGLRLAFTGAIKDDILDAYTLASQLLQELLLKEPACLEMRYGIKNISTADSLLDLVAKARGFKMKGALPDVERAAVTVLDEFRGGKLGRVTLELPPY